MALQQPARNRPRRDYAIVGCTPACSLSAEKLGPENHRLIHLWFNEGIGVGSILIRAKTQLQVKLSNGALGRHKAQHLRIVGDTEPVSPSAATKAATDLEVLEGIITAGWQNAKNWRPSIQDTLKAMDMKYKLTQGSVFDEFFEAISGAQMDEDDAETSPPENPEALSDLPVEELSRADDPAAE